MVADTKNKRGRPITPTGIVARYFNDKETRTAMNMMYAGSIIVKLEQERKAFFVTNKGNFKHQGIAEQIGRMLKEDLISEEEALDLTDSCIADYKNGLSVKEIEKTLRNIRNKAEKGEL